MNVLAYIPAENPGAAIHRSATYQSCLALAVQLGCEVRRHNDSTRSFHDHQIRPGIVPSGEDGAPGDVIIVSSLAVFGPGIVGTLRKFHTRGLRVYSADLGLQPLSTVAPAIEGVAALIKPLREENARLRAENAAIERRWKQSYDDTVTAALTHAVQAALPALVARLPALGETNAKGEPTPAHIGQVIRFERERQGLTPTALGQLCGCAQTSISRLESGEITTGPARDAAMKVLFLDRAKMIEARFKVARVVEDTGGGSVSAAQLIA